MEQQETTRIIEINGVKMEVDMRNAKRIDTFKVGDAVKILDLTYTSPQIRPGVIVGFAEFQKRPAIEIMVLKEDYNGVDFSFITITQDVESKYEVIHYNNYESLFAQSTVLDRFDRLIEKKKLEILEMEQKKKLEILEMEQKKKYFINDFQKAFEQMRKGGE